MPQKNAKKIIKKAVKQAVKQTERKHAKRATKRTRRNTVGRNTRDAIARAPAALVSRLNTLAVEDTVEHRAAAELAKALCCPNMYPSFGVQDGYSSLPTSCASPYMLEPASFSTQPGSAGSDALGIAYDESFAFAYRDPRRALVFYDGSARTFSYEAVFEDGANTTDRNSGTPYDVRSWQVDAGSTTTRVHGDILYTGVVKDGPGSNIRWTPAQSNMVLSFDGLEVSTSVGVTMKVYMGGEVLTFRRIGQSTDGSGTLQINFSDFVNTGDAGVALPKFFYFADVTVTLSGTTGGRLLIKGTAIPVLRQYALADFHDMENIIEKVRFCALNLMYSNTAPALSKNGFCTAWQVPSNMDPVKLMTDGFESLANKPGAERLVIDQGIHIFWKSTDPSDWEYIEVGDADDANDAGSESFIINADSDYLAIATKQPNQDGRAGYWTVFTDVQYRHDVVWLGMGFPDHDRKTFELALEIQGRIPQVHCNPFHIKDIFKWVGQHKNQIRGTLNLIDQASGNRAGQFTNPARGFMDVWFK